MSTTKVTRPVATTVALLLATFLSSVDGTAVGTALPRIVAQLGGFELYSWVFSVYLLTTTATIPIWGKLADVLGRRAALFAGITIFIAGSVACGAAPSMTGLVIARGLQGIGAGAIFPVSQTIFGDMFSVEKRARIQGLFSLVWGVSTIIGPLVGGAIVARWSWRWIFYVNLPIGIVAVVLFLGAFHGRIERRHRELDVLGALVLCSAVMLLLAALMSHGPMGGMLALGALGLLGLFVVVERRAKDPILPIDLLGDRAIVVAAGSGLLMGAILFAFVAFMPLFWQGALGFGPIVSGLVTAPMSFAWSIATFVGGRWLLRSGFRVVVRAGALLVVGGVLAICAAISRLPATSGWFWFITGMIALGAGLGLTLSSFIIAAQDRVAWSRRGVATAILTLTRSLGATLGVAALGMVFVGRVAHDLAGVHGSPAASELLEPRIYGDLPAAILVPARAALGSAMGVVFELTALIAIATAAITFLFPDLKTASSSTEQVEQPAEAFATNDG